MRNTLTLLLFLAIGLQTTSAQETIGFSDPDEVYHLENYRLPTWGYDLLYLDFDGAFSSINQFNDTRNRNTNGRLAPNYFYYRESEEMIINGRVSLPLNLSRSSTKTAADVESSQREFDLLLSAFADGKYYLDDLLFAAGQVEIDINSNRRTTDGDNQPELFRRQADTRLALGAGAGYGRVRNVTPVIRALRFNERLNALNAGSLNDGQLQDLASVFAQRTGYTRVFDRPNRHFWDAISNTAPNILGSMSMYDAYYLSETLMESTGQRFEGWDATAQIFVDHQRYSEKRETDGNTTLDDSWADTELGLNLAGRYFHNLSLEQMISVRANLGFGLYIPDDDEADNERLMLAGFEVGHLYNITDRILVQSALGTNVERFGSGDDSFTYRVFRINSSVTYFIEDNVNVFATISYRNEKEDFGNADRSRSDFGINVGLRYFFINTLAR